ncbi:hypothetical protein [Natrinema sp. SYSU A 869]|uniref:hypothetical protein n=1 Tax=Natrinema sp. SYSU A 869 TaxID=2871694 RepID=UPI001CA44AE8|nr:hypothetical protein [Natrinema sp. SYSU A 869]
MPSNGFLTPFRRDLLLAVVALVFLATPVGVSATNISETTYTYERAEVIVDDEDGITYAGDPRLKLFNTHLSEDIGCSVPQDIRLCAFERQLVANATIPTEVYTSNPSLPSPAFDIGIDRYRYVQSNGSVYEPTYAANRTVQNENGLYRVDLTLESASATDALRDVSIDATTENVDAPSVVVEAARQGTASADHEAEIPQTPVRVDDDTYYRVYRTDRNEPAPLGPFYGIVLSLFGPIIGLSLIYRLSHRIEISYVGEEGP